MGNARDNVFCVIIMWGARSANIHPPQTKHAECRLIVDSRRRTVADVYGTRPSARRRKHANLSGSRPGAQRRNMGMQTAQGQVPEGGTLQI